MTRCATHAGGERHRVEAGSGSGATSNPLKRYSSATVSLGVHGRPSRPPTDGQQVTVIDLNEVEDVVVVVGIRTWIDQQPTRVSATSRLKDASSIPSAVESSQRDLVRSLAMTSTTMRWSSWTKTAPSPVVPSVARSTRPAIPNVASLDPSGFTRRSDGGPAGNGTDTSSTMRSGPSA